MIQPLRRLPSATTVPPSLLGEHPPAHTQATLSDYLAGCNSLMVPDDATVRYLFEHTPTEAPIHRLVRDRDPNRMVGLDEISKQETPPTV